MPRLVRVREARSGLDARFTLLDEMAPASTEVLWSLCATGASHEAIHAIWTGPEISCPIDVSGYSLPVEIERIPLENATSFPAAGDLLLVAAPRGRWNKMPPVDVIDLGFFYADGGRLLMPMGWILGSVCARVLAEDLEPYRSACQKIRASGSCRLVLSQEKT